MDGYVQLRYDLGSGVANLTSPERAQLGEWNSLKVTRNGPFGTLQLNTGQLVTGMSPGSLTELNLELPLYLGGYEYVFDKYPKFLLLCIFFLFLGNQNENQMPRIGYQTFANEMSNCTF